METIAIEVPLDIAQAYYAADEVKQQKLKDLVTAFFRANLKVDSLSDIIAEMQNQASRNGLTQEILNDILNND